MKRRSCNRIYKGLSSRRMIACTTRRSIYRVSNRNRKIITSENSLVQDSNKVIKRSTPSLTGISDGNFRYVTNDRKKPKKNHYSTDRLSIKKKVAPSSMSSVVSAASTTFSMFYSQNKLLYQNHSVNRSFYPPKDYGIEENKFEEIFFNAQDGTELQSYFVKVHDDTISSRECPTVVFFHGNSGNLSHRMRSISSFVHHLGVNVFILSYRGYGKSKGEPSQEGLLTDAKSAIEFLSNDDMMRKQIDPSKLLIFGRSLGGAVAIHALTEICERKGADSGILGMIVENTFTCIPDMVELAFPYLKMFKSAIKDEWRNIDEVKKIPREVPVLFLSGEKDELVPRKQMQKLYDVCTSDKKKAVLFEEEGHNGMFRNADYINQIKLFLKEKKLLEYSK